MGGRLLFCGGGDGVNSVGGAVNGESVHEIGIGTLANMHHGMSRVSYYYYVIVTSSIPMTYQIKY